MQITEHVCDECGKKRTNDTNHWFRPVISHRGNFCVLPFNTALTNGRERPKEWIDVCGQDCAVKVFSRWLSTGKLNAEVPNGKS